MAPSTPPPPSRVEFAALTMAVTSCCVISPTSTRTRPARKDSSLGLLTAWLGCNFVKHILTSQRVRNRLRFVLGQRMFWICARNLKHSFIKHHYSQRSKCDAGSNKDFIHIVDAEAARLFNPIFDEGIAQSVLGLRLGKIRAFNNETIFAHFFGLLSRSFFRTRTPPAGVRTSPNLPLRRTIEKDLYYL